MNTAPQFTIIECCYGTLGYSFAAGNLVKFAPAGYAFNGNGDVGFNPAIDIATSSDRTSCIGSIVGQASTFYSKVQIGGIQELIYTGTKPIPGDWLVLSSTSGCVEVGTRANAVALAVGWAFPRKNLVRAYMLVPNTA